MLSFQDVSFNYDNQILFDSVNLELSSGEFAFLIGKSGSGKTSLLTNDLYEFTAAFGY